MKFKTLSVVSSLALVASLATPAYAQDATTGEAATGTVDEQLEEQQETGFSNEIIVTAQFREQNLQDTPIAITAVNSEMLEARGDEVQMDAEDLGNLIAVENTVNTLSDKLLK